MSTAAERRNALWRKYLEVRQLERPANQRKWQQIRAGKTQVLNEGTGTPLAHPRKEYLTVEEVADRKGTSVRRVNRAIDDRKLAAEKPGSWWLVWKPDVERWKPGKAG